MLHLLDEALEGLVRRALPLDRRDVDVTFAAPTSEWSAALTRPTVNLYLWAVVPSSTDADAGMELVEHEGRLVRRPRLPRVDCSYLATTWAAEPADEHQLLAALLAIALTSAELERPDLPDGLASVDGPPPRLRVARGDDRRIVDLWSAMGSRLRPCVDLVVTATLEAATVTAAGPPVTSREVVVRGGEAEDRRRAEHGPVRTE